MKAILAFVLLSNLNAFAERPVDDGSATFHESKTETARPEEKKFYLIRIKIKQEENIATGKLENIAYREKIPKDPNDPLEKNRLYWRWDPTYGEKGSYVYSLTGNDGKFIGEDGKIGYLADDSIIPGHWVGNSEDLKFKYNYKIEKVGDKLEPKHLWAPFKESLSPMVRLNVVKKKDDIIQLKIYDPRYAIR